MATWSVLPFGNLAWFAGIAALTWILARWEHQRAALDVSAGLAVAVVDAR
jgi:hypothetical protein